MEKLLKKNVWRLVTAYFFWSFAYAVVDAFLTYHRPGRDFLVSVIENTFTGRYHLWFVTMMIALYLLVPVLRKIAEDERLVRYFILLSFLFCYVGNLLRVLPAVGETAGIVLDKMSIVMVGGYTGYFFAGYYFYHFGICEKRKKLLYAGRHCICTVYNSCYLTFKSESRCGRTVLSTTTCFRTTASRHGRSSCSSKRNFRGSSGRKKRCDGLKNSLSLALACIWCMILSMWR